MATIEEVGALAAEALSLILHEFVSVIAEQPHAKSKTTILRRERTHLLYRGHLLEHMN